MADRAFRQRCFEAFDVLSMELGSSNVQILQFCEFTDLRWKSGELIAVEVQLGQIRELSNFGWQRGEFVAVEFHVEQLPRKLC